MQLLRRGFNFAWPPETGYYLNHLSRRRESAFRLEGPAITNRTPIFVHIPKTAGSTLKTLFSVNYLSGFADYTSLSDDASSFPEGKVLNLYGTQREVFDFCMSIPRHTRPRLRLVQGHFPYGVHDYLGLREYQYFFFLREPVARMVSDVDHATRYDSHFYHRALSDPSLNESRRLARATEFTYYRNTATHFLSGSFYTRETTLTDFHIALERVRRSEFVGLTEHTETSILIMGRKLGWTHVVPFKCNVSPTAPPIDDQVRETCLPALEYDIQLYEAARERFDEEVDGYGSLLTEAAEQLAELVQQQQTEYPETIAYGQYHGGYRVGNELPIPLDRYADRIEPRSPLDLWLAESADIRRSA